ncbi:Alpha/Beta hydrolase protein [Bisporella sp. PMI_857]|nr:Alpha/Beta hydrolase protein [Bisporella sp. PMI_857]
MPLSFEPEYAKALEPLLPMLAALPPPKVHDVEGRRQQMKGFFESSTSIIPEAPGVSIDTLAVKSYDGADITIFHVYPKKEASPGETSPAFIHAHGGGMIAGSAETFIKATALTVAATQVQFFSVNYRKAPEHPHPAPTEDVYAALTWVKENATKFNIDPTRIGITGESAGGGIAAGVAIMARDREMSPPLAKQVLIYPMLDDRNLSPIDGIEELALWKSSDNVTGWTALLSEQAGKEGVSPYAAPARVASVQGLPPLYIDVGELDIFKAEVIEYITRFTRANISTEFHLYPGLPHGWEAIAPRISATKKAMENRIRALTSI